MSNPVPISIVEELELGSVVTLIHNHMLVELISDIVALPRVLPLWPRHKLTTPAVEILM